MTPNTFWKLLQDREVVIPLMQRDYAQGRPDDRAPQILRDFLEALHGALTNPADPKPGIDLDFLYGNAHGGKLTLLDGQQRVTTLFLLHWYLASRAGELTQVNKERLGRFTYETRVSSRLFCDALVRETVALDGETVSRPVKDAPWFFRVWERDPTINSMLGALDAIHAVFGKCDAPALWNTLMGQDPIRFEFLQMEEYALTDELYVKMNARGRPLTDFENFKAWLEEHAGSALSEDQKRAIDLEWTDLFWKLRQGARDIGPAYLQFFKGMALNRALAGDKDAKPLQPEQITRLNENQYVSTAFYEEYDFFDAVTIHQCCTVLDLLKGDGLRRLDEEWLKGLPCYFPAGKESLFRRFISPKVTYVDRLYFYGLCQFLLAAQVQPFADDAGMQTALRRWMRVVRNLTLNTTINVASFAGCLEAIRLLAREGCLHICEHLRDAAPAIRSFLDYQVREERTKAGLILREGEDWEKELAAAEDHPFIQGQISFLLEFSREGEEFKLERFKEYSQKVRNIFVLANEKAMTGESVYLLSRAMLTKRPWWIEVTSTTEDYSFAPRRQQWIDEIFRKKNNAEILREVLDEIVIGQETAGLGQIIERWIPNPADWRDEFIRTREAVGYGSHHWSRHESDHAIYLLNGQRMNGQHVELRSYGFYKRYLTPVPSNLAPLGAPDYWRRSLDSLPPFAYLNGRVFQTWLRYHERGNPETFGYELKLVPNQDKSLPSDLADLLTARSIPNAWDESHHTCRIAVAGGEMAVLKILGQLADLTRRHCPENAPVENAR